MSKNIVFEGWLTKSPPAKRIWRTKWRRRWFSLRQSGELPGQYFLDYFADRNGRRLKGTINLDLCQQVDAGLHMEHGNGSLDPKRGLVFTVRTPSRTYHLQADSESDMEQWVDAICRVCGLRSTEDASNNIAAYQNNIGAVPPANNQSDPNKTGPYIPISECITGERSQDVLRAFTFAFDPKDIRPCQRKCCQRMPTNRTNQIYTSQPQIRVNPEFSENESNGSEDDCRSLNASHSHIGPPVPPRPPKTLATLSIASSHKEAFQGPKIQEPTEDSDNSNEQSSPWLRAPQRVSHGQSPSSPARMRYEDDDDISPSHSSLQYYNLPSLPPAVDRALKPRHASFGRMQQLIGNQKFSTLQNNVDVLQYLDLDLHTSKPSVLKPRSRGATNKQMAISHGKSYSEAEADDDYKSVDFLKTEAFNIMRLDAEASRNVHHSTHHYFK